ncbi:MAG: hypothetical protein LBU72_02115 [Burkholderiaceae bacterium]|jgi:hypothetical protein|nr:hypothetical protein [Burkholderiaceae bacterium]
MLKLSAFETRRILRANLAPSEPQLADMVRQIRHLNEQDWPPDKLLEHTRRGLDSAIGHDLSTLQDIMGFLTLRHVFGERFDEFPAVRKFLVRADLPTGNRIQLMMLTLPPLIWDVVQRRTPPGPSAPIRAGFSA